MCPSLEWDHSSCAVWGAGFLRGGARGLRLTNRGLCASPGACWGWSSLVRVGGGGDQGGFPEDGTERGRGTEWPRPRELTPGLVPPGCRPLPATPCRPRPAPVHRFPVIVAPGTKLESGPATLHLCNDILVVARDVPPAVAGQWKLSDLRRYGAVPNGFIFEGGTRCGFCKYGRGPRACWLGRGPRASPPACPGLSRARSSLRSQRG